MAVFLQTAATPSSPQPCPAMPAGWYVAAQTKHTLRAAGCCHPASDGTRPLTANYLTALVSSKHVVNEDIVQKNLIIRSLYTSHESVIAD